MSQKQLKTTLYINNNLMPVISLSANDKQEPTKIFINQIS